MDNNTSIKIKIRIILTTFPNGDGSGISPTMYQIKLNTSARISTVINVEIINPPVYNSSTILFMIVRFNLVKIGPRGPIFTNFLEVIPLCHYSL